MRLLAFLYEKKDGEETLSIGRVMVILVFLTVWILFWIVKKTDPPDSMMDFLWSGMIYVGFTKIVVASKEVIEKVFGKKAE